MDIKAYSEMGKNAWADYRNILAADFLGSKQSAERGLSMSNTGYGVKLSRPSELTKAAMAGLSARFGGRMVEVKQIGRDADGWVARYDPARDSYVAWQDGEVLFNF